MHSKNERGQFYNFFLSELKEVDDPTLALIIELMRASQHIKDVHKLMEFMSANDLGDEDEMFYEAEMESLQTMVLNLSAAQLREAMKVFWKFTETDYFKKIRTVMLDDEKEAVSKLIELNSDVSSNKGFICESLIPIRNLMFHYQVDDDAKKVISWILDRREMERDRKPPYQTVNLEKFEFGTGFEYERFIYARYLFWGSERFDAGMKWQELVFKTQVNFLLATRGVVRAMFKYEKIETRSFEWMLRYVGGYKNP